MRTIVCAALLGAFASGTSALAAEKPLSPITAAPLTSTGDSRPTGSGESGLPQAGDYQLFLDAPPILNATNLVAGTVPHGMGLALAGGVTTVALGLNGGVGYALTDLFEIGGALAINYGGTADANSFEFAVEPFVKINLGRQLLGKGGINPFASLGLIFGGASAGYTNYGYTGSNGTALFGFDLDLGAEFMVTHNWGVSAFIPFDLIAPTNGAPATFGFGVGYGLVAYF